MHPKVKIIAECGINWSPSFDKALEMIRIAAECGADVAKFQLYEPRELLNEQDFIREYGEENWQCVLDAQLGMSECSELKLIAEKVGIELLFSVFHPRYITWCESLGVKRYKIAANQIGNIDLIEAVMKTGKPIIISCPYGEPPGIWLHAKFLYCVPEYPADKDLYKNIAYGTFYDGISDHTIGIGTAIDAIANGAKIVEKHFTLDRNLPGPDQECSIEPFQLEALVAYANDLHHPSANE